MSPGPEGWRHTKKKQPLVYVKNNITAIDAPFEDYEIFKNVMFFRFQSDDNAIITCSFCT